MAVERWGSLSVSDHVDIYGLVANALLYDKLVVPVMAVQPDRNERDYWEKHGWNPDLQQKRLAQLGDIAVKREWNRARREVFKTRYAQLAAEKSDAAALHATRRILAEEPVALPPGIQHVDVIAAYSSLNGIKKDFDIRDPDDGLGAQALLISRRFCVPAEADPEHSLEVALQLSRDPEFRARRRELFDWQESIRAKGLDPQGAVNHLIDLVGHYNRKVEAAASKVEVRFAFTVIGAVVGFMTGGAGAAAAGAALSLVQFATLDREPAVEAGALSPFAMFHDLEVKLGYRLR